MHQSDTRSTYLRGVRIWLSGAIPPEATDNQRASMICFVRDFAATVFKSGGHILHGSHPTLTPILLKEAALYIASGGRKDCLTLAVSKLWSKNTEAVPLQTWRQICMVYETPEASGENARDESLAILRDWMSERCDAFVAVGGMWWNDVGGRAGIPVEAGLAIDRGLPCFVLGGLGGAAKDYVRNNPVLLRNLKNGFDEETNARIATQEDVASLIDVITEQLCRLPVVRGRVVEGVTFRILALDGGGIKGAYTASVLATLSKALGEPIGERFDLIAGTSTGGILAVGLGLGLSAEDMLQFYRVKGPVIFPIMRLHRQWRREAQHFFRPKHSQEILFSELKKAYFPDGKEISLGRSTSRLVIPAYDATSGACHTFRTPHHHLLKTDENTNAAEVALASAAAPTYFSSAKVKNMVANAPYFDGGIWANCPAMTAIVEAVCYLGVPLDRIDILSIGTTDEPFTVKNLAKAGIVGWGKTLLDLFMNAQVDSTVKHAQQLVGEPRFLRINSVTGPGEYTLDNAAEIENLITLGNKKASDPAILSQVKSRFLNGISAMDWRSENS